MRRSLRGVLLAIGGAAVLLGASPAQADTQGTPNEPPTPLPPTEPPPAPANEETVVVQPQEVPTYGQAQKRQRHERTHWYGWQTLIVDGGVTAASIGLASANGSAGGVLAVTGYLFGAPIVHWSHGQIGRGFVSLGMRVGAPLVFGTLGYAVFTSGRGSGDFAGAAGFVLGFGFGMLSAIVVDAAALAYERIDESDEDARAALRRRQARRPLTWSPWAAPRTEGGALLGVSGTL